MELKCLQQMTSTFTLFCRPIPHNCPPFSSYPPTVAVTISWLLFQISSTVLTSFMLITDCPLSSRLCLIIGWRHHNHHLHCRHCCLHRRHLCCLHCCWWYSCCCHCCCDRWQHCNIITAVVALVIALWRPFGGIEPNQDQGQAALPMMYGWRHALGCSKWWPTCLWSQDQWKYSTLREQILIPTWNIFLSLSYAIALYYC